MNVEKVYFMNPDGRVKESENENIRRVMNELGRSAKQFCQLLHHIYLYILSWRPNL